MRLMRGGLWDRIVAATLAVGGLAIVGATPIRAAAATSTTYLTVQIAHTEESLTDRSCHQLAGVVSLEQQAAAYHAMGITNVTGTVITNWMNVSTLQCRRPYLMASWQEMAGLQQNDGWSFVSGSVDGAELTTLSTTAAKAEMCQSGTIITQKGLSGAWGEFAFPDNKTNSQLEQLALSCGYAFGRRYGSGTNAVPVAKPYWLSTYSFNGGACADPASACYQVPTRFHYTNPALLAAAGRPNPGHWTVVQAYTFVTGAVTSNTVSWDCTSTDWHEHWTSGGDASEIYCWNDWLSALRSWRGDQFVTPNQMRNQRQA